MAEPAEPATADVVRLNNKWDPSEVKRVLDECASQVVAAPAVCDLFAELLTRQAVLDAGYEEDMFISNTKIGLGLLTCATALLAQFYPKPFPENYWLLVACVVVYFSLNTALQAFAHFKEKDFILCTRPKQGAPQQPGLTLSSGLGKYSDIYFLTLRSCAAGDAAPSKPAELRKSVTAWFYDDGELAQDVFKSDVLRLLSTFERGRAKSE